MKKFLSVRYLFFCMAAGGLAAVLILIELVLSWETVWFLPSVFILIVLALLFVISFFYLWKPYRETTRIMGIFAARLMVEELDRIEVYYNPQFKILTERLEESMKASSAFELSKRQAQYQALQNQINPHFLYNTLESIRSEALMAGMDSVAKMCEALANFFRYTISNVKDTVSVQDEIQNIQNYFYIQQYRFGDRMKLIIDYSKEDQDVIFKCTLPKLTLQPIVENAIIHGIEQKIGEGTVTIRLMLTKVRVLIYVMDNGMGIDEKTLYKINQNIQSRSVQRQERNGIAISNVSNRIKLLFGEEYGIIVYSSVGVGTDVEITLPRTEKRQEMMHGKDRKVGLLE